MPCARPTSRTMSASAPASSSTPKARTTRSWAAASILADYARDSGLRTDARTGARTRVRAVVKPVSQGKAAGLNDAIQLATGELLLFTDARQQIESGALRLLIENFADPEVGAASGA